MTLSPLLKDWKLFLALGAGSGLVRRAPGTAGTALAWGVYAVLALFVPPAALLALGVLMCIAGVPLCTYAERALQRSDDGRIVWDEIAAFFVLLPLLPSSNWAWQAVAFAAFRLLDIAKPFPINVLDKKLHGGAGVMADDLAAAATALLGVHLLYAFAA